MLWIVNEEASHQIISCNTHEEAGRFQLWVTRPNGKSLKLKESDNKDEILEIKQAIDFALEHKEPTLKLS